MVQKLEEHRCMLKGFFTYGKNNVFGILFDKMRLLLNSINENSFTDCGAYNVSLKF